MADIELVIKIPENTYKRIQALVSDDYFEHDICGNSMRRIANGIPLPKGHGDLIDRRELKRNWNGIETSVGYRKVIDFQAIDIAKPIIEADKGE